MCKGRNEVGARGKCKKMDGARHSLVNEPRHFVLTIPWADVTVSKVDHKLPLLVQTLSGRPGGIDIGVGIQGRLRDDRDFGEDRSVPSKKKKTSQISKL